jgi:DNA mismatch endonuclease (patch repair protein)
MPKTRQEFWGPKIAGNRERDARNEAALQDAGWRVLIVWECCLVGTGRWKREELHDRIANWVRGENLYLELEGAPSS